MLARSTVMHRVFESITAVAQTDATVLIVGETGTGKELVARAVHERSARKAGPFVPVHTGAIPKDLIESELFGHEKGAFTGAISAAEGKFGAAKGGTIFLDEVSTMSDRAQVDLLRVLETFKYTRVGGKVEHIADVRVVCATNRDLLAMAHENKFREDLYYRINIFPITLPPLRQRLEDIGLLADRFMRAAAERYKRPVRAAARVGRSSCSCRTRGRATCASCATSSSRRCCSSARSGSIRSSSIACSSSVRSARPIAAADDLVDDDRALHRARRHHAAVRAAGAGAGGADRRRHQGRGRRAPAGACARSRRTPATASPPAPRSASMPRASMSSSALPATRRSPPFPTTSTFFHPTGPLV